MNNEPVAVVDHRQQNGVTWLKIKKGKSVMPDHNTLLYTHPANELAEDLEGAKLVILKLNDMLRQQALEIQALHLILGYEGVAVGQDYLEECVAELRKAQDK